MHRKPVRRRTLLLRGVCPVTGLIFLDTETTGLDLMINDVWEIAWAVDHEPITSGLVPHSLYGAQTRALQINHYADRCNATNPLTISTEIEDSLYDTFNEWHRRHGTPLTVVGANPQFDLYRLSRRWDWNTPWHYRAIDISVFAMPILGHQLPQGLEKIARELDERGYAISRTEDTAHSAAADVRTVRDCYYALILANDLRGN